MLCLSKLLKPLTHSLVHFSDLLIGALRVIAQFTYSGCQFTHRDCHLANSVDYMANRFLLPGLLLRQLQLQSGLSLLVRGQSFLVCSQLLLVRGHLLLICRQNGVGIGHLLQPHRYQLDGLLDIHWTNSSTPEAGL